MLLKKYTILILYFIITLFSTNVWAKKSSFKSSINSYSIAPTIIELDLNRNRSGFLLLTNNTKKTYKIKIKCKYFTPKKLLVGKHIYPEISKIEDISKLIIISPRVVKLGPLSKRKIRFSLRPDGKHREPGEYRASFVFTPVLKPENLKKKETVNKGLQAKISWILEIMMPVYITVGERGESRILVKPSIYKKDNKTYLKLSLKNPSKWRYPVKFEVFDAKTKEKISSKSTVMLRGTENTIEFPLEKAPTSKKIILRWKSYLENIPAEPGELTLSL